MLLGQAFILQRFAFEIEINNADYFLLVCFSPMIWLMFVTCSNYFDSEFLASFFHYFFWFERCSKIAVSHYFSSYFLLILQYHSHHSFLKQSSVRRICAFSIRRWFSQMLTYTIWDCAHYPYHFACWQSPHLIILNSFERISRLYVYLCFCFSSLYFLSEEVASDLICYQTFLKLY